VPLSGLRRRLGWPSSERERFRRWLAGRRLPIDRAAYMIGGKICVDDFIRYETLEADMARICAHVGVPWEPERLPRYNGGHRRPDATADSLYSPAAIRMVTEAYRREIALFGYAPPTMAR
jgi:hypothetical protein